MLPESTDCPTCAENARRAENAERMLALYKRIIWGYVNAPTSDAEDARAAA
jgi:hypothetical protein